jgi:hypothetical protein
MTARTDNDLTLYPLTELNMTTINSSGRSIKDRSYTWTPRNIGISTVFLTYPAVYMSVTTYVLPAA